MWHNRLRPAGDTPPSGFVSCPLPVSQSPTQQAAVLAVYRLAADLTRRQLAPPRLPAFSNN